MAGHSPFISIIFFFFFFLYFIFAFSVDGKQLRHSSDLHRHPSTGVRKEKMSHLHFFFHDKLGGSNITAVPVAASPTSSKSPTNFGSVTVIDDALTEGPDLTSKLVGRAQGLYASASLETDGLLMAMNFGFINGKYNGSTLAVLGRNLVFSDVREMPVVGGSGLFRFARGYVLAQTHRVQPGLTTIEYNVYVIHY